VDYFGKVLTKRLLPAFDNLQEESDNVSAVAQQRIESLVDPEWADPASIAETAYHEGVDHYIMASAIKQGMINMFAVGLCHMFEQQCLKFHRQELLLPQEENDSNLLKLSSAKDRLLKNYKIDVHKFSSFSKIKELKLLANCVKHGDGASCQKLKRIKETMFVYPAFRDENENFSLSKSSQVMQPMAGQDLYITIEEFEEYLESVKEFWDELGKAFEEADYIP